MLICYVVMATLSILYYSLFAGLGMCMFNVVTATMFKLFEATNYPSSFIAKYFHHTLNASTTCYICNDYLSIPNFTSYTYIISLYLCLLLFFFQSTILLLKNLRNTKNLTSRKRQIATSFSQIIHEYIYIQSTPGFCMLTFLSKKSRKNLGVFN